VIQILLHPLLQVSLFVIICIVPPKLGMSYYFQCPPAIPLCVLLSVSAVCPYIFLSVSVCPITACQSRWWTEWLTGRACNQLSVSAFVCLLVCLPVVNGLNPGVSIVHIVWSSERGLGLKRTVVGDWRFANLIGSHLQIQVSGVCWLMML